MCARKKRASGVVGGALRRSGALCWFKTGCGGHRLILAGLGWKDVFREVVAAYLCLGTVRVSLCREKMRRLLRAGVRAQPLDRLPGPMHHTELSNDNASARKR
jgi:hypothetical protein